MDHVDSRRLLELARLSVIVDQPEWEHIRKCNDCGKAFIVLKAAAIRRIQNRPATAIQVVLHRLEVN